MLMLLSNQTKFYKAILYKFIRLRRNSYLKQLRPIGMLIIIHKEHK